MIKSWDKILTSRSIRQSVNVARYLGTVLLLSSVMAILLAAPAVLAQSAPPAGFNFDKPNLEIPIPTVNFSGVDFSKDGTNAAIPYIAEYITGLYAYLVSIAGVVAVVMMIIGGFQYLTAGGDAGRMKAAKERITNAVAGILLTLGAYTLLNTISPQLVQLKPLSLNIVPPEETDFTLAGPGMPGTDNAADSSAYDDIFKKYAACAGLDWRVLKAIAKKESGFNASVANSYGYIGLFQTSAKNCSLNKYGRAAECESERLKDPDSNTASAAGGQLKSGTNALKSRCPDIKSTESFVTLLYYGHNSGTGALNHLIDKAGCNASIQEYQAASSEFYAAKQAKLSKEIPNKDGRVLYAQKVAKQAASYGVTDPFNTSDSPACPLK